MCTRLSLSLAHVDRGNPVRSHVWGPLLAHSSGLTNMGPHMVKGPGVWRPSEWIESLDRLCNSFWTVFLVGCRSRGPIWSRVGEEGSIYFIRNVTPKHFTANFRSAETFRFGGQTKLGSQTKFSTMT